MRSSPCIEPAQLKDAPEIARLTGELGYPITLAETKANLEKILKSTRHFVAVSRGQDDKVLGWVVAERCLSLDSGESAEITGLIVSADAKRMGIGRSLVAAAEQWVTRQGFSSVRVRSNVVRTESHPFYQGVGFQHQKTQHVYVKALS
ncbi:GNAT family N-acetyltransferase [Uliginosibacterium gangwonense]|uniref:GNAT family N-acetyltransferase n=1 Tax=Uliginosibacterium gangwonense TaxID=392736 RepID=UPI00036E41BA|nr:N-acetyltransferase [Uliginosibacterium gangwonense]